MENQETIVFLNQLLANQHVLYIKTRNAHWNITGIDFKPVHSFFQELYTKFENDIDLIAERIRKLGSPVVANMQYFLDAATLSSNEPTAFNSIALISYISSDLTIINETIRIELEILSANKSTDYGTINFLTNLLEENEKTLWFLNSH